MHLTHTAFAAWNLGGGIGYFFQMNPLRISDSKPFNCKYYTILVL